VAAEISFSLIGTVLVPTTKRSRINRGSTPASTRRSPLLSRDDKLQSAFNAEARSSAHFTQALPESISFEAQ
jgi:hypothetical protein